MLLTLVEGVVAVTLSAAVAVAEAISLFAFSVNGKVGNGVRDVRVGTLFSCSSEGLILPSIVLLIIIIIIIIIIIHIILVIEIIIAIKKYHNNKNNGFDNIITKK